jgi:transposase
LGKFLLRQQLTPARQLTPWTKGYRTWLEAVRLSHASHQLVLRDYLTTVDRAEERVAELDKDLAQHALHSPQAPLIAALQSFRGIALTTAIVLAAELGDLHQFPSPRDLMGYTGLVIPALSGTTADGLPKPATRTCGMSWSRRRATIGEPPESGARSRSGKSAC